MPDVVAVRDSKDPAGPALTFSPTAWATFVAGIKHGEFDAASFLTGLGDRAAPR
ncbi:DUF397 domain-containing protein [Planosporangium flavigriseum]|nr:DUF397 domain-containing protein [Planosporangium flavigriseum]